MADDDAMAKAAMTGRRHRRSLSQRIMDATGNHWGGSASPPMSNHKTYVYDDGVYRVFSMQDDGGFVGIGYPDQWHVIMRREAARMLAWWMLKLWIKNWFGLREWAYYVALHRHGKGEWKLFPYGSKVRRNREMTRPSSYDEWFKSGERV